MRELIEGVTKIRGLEGRGSIHGKGVLTYCGIGDPVPIWEGETGEIFEWGVGVGEGRYWEFVDDGEVPKLKVGDCVKHNKSNMTGVVLDISESEYPIYVGWENGANGCYDQKDLVSVATTTPPQQPITKLKEDVKVMHETLGAKVKSTGSSSDYYKIVLPEWLLLKQKDNGFIMLEDLAEIMFDNNFNYVNVMKAQKRMFDLEGGRGKEGNTFEYDATKCKYYIDKQVEVFNREQEDK